MGAGHDHGEVVTPPHVRGYVLWVLVPLVVVTVVGMIWLWPREDTPSLGSVNTVTGKIEKIAACDPPDPECQQIDVVVTSGEFEGQRARLDMQAGASGPILSEGGEVWLNADVSSGQLILNFADVKRDGALIYLVLLFSAAVVVLSRWKGVAALAGLAASILILAAFILPALLIGTTPLAVAAVGAAAIAIATMGLAHGFTMRTGVALIGTVAALLLTAVLGYAFSAAALFTGVGSEDAWYLQNSSANLTIDFRGLFLAGLVIGALGVLDDVTVTQAAAVWEVRRVAPESSWRQLWSAGMRVGRDHVAATVNTLVLAYIGASLPLFLILVMSEAPLAQSLTNELIAQEVVRSLVGGLGIVAAVPFTTFLAAWVLTRKHEEEEEYRPFFAEDGDARPAVDGE